MRTAPLGCLGVKASGLSGEFCVLVPLGVFVSVTFKGCGGGGFCVSISRVVGVSASLGAGLYVCCCREAGSSGHDVPQGGGPG